MSALRKVRAATRELRRDVADMHFAPPVVTVYNPLDYARRTHDAYLGKYADGRKRILFLGMNPGPYGMAQTGVPFGAISWVRDWLEIEGRVDRPEPEHPKRPVEGFGCRRKEVSGDRLWGAVSHHWGTPERFFEDHFVANYCPLVFMEESGRNRTPDKLQSAERDALFECCDRYLQRLVAAWAPDWVIGIGAFAAKRAAAALAEVDDTPSIATVLHPSPANPRANRDWVGEVRAQLSDLRICHSPRDRAGRDKRTRATAKRRRSR
jgi:single-strand selective monofunctional uracil DNA glycosylase